MEREYDSNTLFENLKYLQSQGRTNATIPELTGKDHLPPPTGHPLIDLEGLEQRLLSAPPAVTIPLSDSVSLTIKKNTDGGMITIQGTF